MGYYEGENEGMIPFSRKRPWEVKYSPGALAVAIMI